MRTLLYAAWSEASGEHALHHESLTGTAVFACRPGQSQRFGSRATRWKACMESRMTPLEFKAWRIEMGFSSQQQAADALGISKSTVEQYESGRRRDNGQPVGIPVYIDLACKALRMSRGNAYSGDDRVERWHISASEKYLEQIADFRADSDLAKRHFQLTYGITRPEGQEIEP